MTFSSSRTLLDNVKNSENFTLPSRENRKKKKKKETLRV